MKQELGHGQLHDVWKGAEEGAHVEIEVEKTAYVVMS
jgi:hypothetical protein